MILRYQKVFSSKELELEDWESGNIIAAVASQLDCWLSKTHRLFDWYIKKVDSLESREMYALFNDFERLFLNLWLAFRAKKDGLKEREHWDLISCRLKFSYPQPTTSTLIPLFHPSILSILRYLHLENSYLDFWSTNPHSTCNSSRSRAPIHTMGYSTTYDTFKPHSNQQELLVENFRRWKNRIPMVPMQHTVQGKVYSELRFDPLSTHLSTPIFWQILIPSSLSLLFSGVPFFSLTLPPGDNDFDKRQFLDACRLKWINYWCFSNEVKTLQRRQFWELVSLLCPNWNKGQR